MKEARAAALLRSPHIAVTYDISEFEGALFIVMEYVEGALISEKLATNPLSVEDAVDVAMQVAEALEEAHSYGIVHRDIKSANIIVTARGLAKVLDFGLAKFLPGKNPGRPTRPACRPPRPVWCWAPSRTCHRNRSSPAGWTIAPISSPLES